MPKSSNQSNCSANCGKGNSSFKREGSELLVKEDLRQGRRISNVRAVAGMHRQPLGGKVNSVGHSTQSRECVQPRQGWGAWPIIHEMDIHRLWIPKRILLYFSWVSVIRGNQRVLGLNLPVEGHIPKVLCCKTNMSLHIFYSFNTETQHRYQNLQNLSSYESSEVRKKTEAMLTEKGTKCLHVHVPSGGPYFPLL